MAKKYENVEKVKELLDEKQLGQLQKRIFSTEKSLADVLKKLSALEADKTEKEAALLKEEPQDSFAAQVSPSESKNTETENTSAPIPSAYAPSATVNETTPDQETKKSAAKENDGVSSQPYAGKSAGETNGAGEANGAEKISQKAEPALKSEKTSAENRSDSTANSAAAEKSAVSEKAQTAESLGENQPAAKPAAKESVASETKSSDAKTEAPKTDAPKTEKIAEGKTTPAATGAQRGSQTESAPISAAPISAKEPVREQQKPAFAQSGDRRVDKGERRPERTDRPPFRNDRTGGQDGRPVQRTQSSYEGGQRPAYGANAGSATSRPAAATPGAPRAPRYFRNGQEQGVYIAKPGVDMNASSSSSSQGQGYRPRPMGDRPPRPMGDRSSRPMGDRPYPPRNGAPSSRPRPSGGAVAAPLIPKESKTFTTPAKKKVFDKTYVEKKPVSKRTLVKQQGMTVEDFDEDKSGYRKLRTPKKQSKREEIQTVKIENAVVTMQEIPLKVLSDKLGISAVEITKRLFKEGIMKSINDCIDFDNAALIAADLGIELEYKPEKTAEEVLHDAVVTEEEQDKLVARAPIVTVMGHVDHGKTSLLDKIRASSVASGEAGGITQSIGAYTVTAKGKQITFIDTPGHAAFTAMRARGAQVTDIVVLVVAADDGIMPQTIEAINHAKSAEVPIIVALNKMDKPEINPDRVKQELLQQNLVPEEWGGETMVVPVSAKTGMGLDELLEAISLQAEMLELTANPDRDAKGTIIEAKLDKGKGPVASIIVQNGTLHTGDNILSGTTMGRVRAMFDDKGRAVKSAGPSMAVSVLGLEDVPNAGDSIMAVDQALMKQVREERYNKEREGMIKEQGHVTLDDVFAQVEEGKMKNLTLVVKADVQGSVEAVKQALEKMSNEEVRVKVIHAAAGAVNESDIMLAESAKAIVVAFNVRPDVKARALAESSKVDVRTYRIIYELIDDIEAALKGMLSPKMQDNLLGKCEVRQTFNITGVGTIAGCYVTEGKILRGGKLRIYRDDIMICEGGVKQLKRFKDDVKEVAKGYECGCAIEGFNEIRVGDIIECYVTEEIKQA